MTLRFAKVRVRGLRRPVSVRIGSRNKPALPADFAARWRPRLASLARGSGMDHALVTELGEERIFIRISSDTEGNPFPEGASDSLLAGFYCEAVVARNRRLAVEDAGADPLWADNPDMVHGLRSYVGLPLLWPDGECFGTLCLLGRLAASAGPSLLVELQALKDAIEGELAELLDRARRPAAQPTSSLKV